MLRRISLTNILNQIKFQRPEYSYQPLNLGNNQESIYNSSSNEKVFQNSKESEITNEFHDKSKLNQKRTYQCPTRRILSKDSEEIFEIVYEIHPGFTSEQILLIENALQIVIDRLFKARILDNMYEICDTSGCYLTDQIWLQSDLTNKKFSKDKYLLIKYQLMCLKSKSENGELPTINIYPTDQENDKENETHSTYVSCISHGSTYFIDGEFEVKLNQNKLNRCDENNSNPLFWAGVIVYELLRNLGHLSIDTSNSHQSQIDVFKNCFLYDGKYLPNKIK